MVRESFSGRWMTLATAAVVLSTAAGCSMKKSETPGLSGPSELGMSLTMSATPDVLVKDGRAQSVIGIQARNAQNQPVAGLGLKVEVYLNRVIVDYGRLSTKDVTTGADGRATVTYTAPQGAISGNSEADETTVEIAATPVSTDHSTALPRTIEIRLMPQGTILPPNGTPTAAFKYSPTDPLEGQTILFDASSSKDDGSITAYDWNFGDGSSGSGVQVSHAFKVKGNYTVTLRVTDDRGASATLTAQLSVAESSVPKADFSFSPGAPMVNQAVFFNAAASSAQNGRTLVSYDWTFGDGGTGSGVNVSHRFGSKAAFSVTLTVTDDIGKSATTSKTITIADDLVPTAEIVISPTAPAVGDLVNFDARLSTAPSGRTLVEWLWNFGDGNTDSGERVTHRYVRAGSYVVTLTVRDNAGMSNSVTSTVTVK